MSVDPFGVPLTNRTNSTEGSLEKTAVANADNPFSVSAFDDMVSVTSSQGKWEAFGDYAANGVKETIKPVVVSSNGQRVSHMVSDRIFACCDDSSVAVHGCGVLSVPLVNLYTLSISRGERLIFTHIYSIFTDLHK